jgi:hypothetical protein
MAAGGEAPEKRLESNSFEPLTSKIEVVLARTCHLDVPLPVPQLEHVHAVPAHASDVILAGRHLYRRKRQLETDRHLLKIDEPHPGYIVGPDLEPVDVDDPLRQDEEISGNLTALNVVRISLDRNLDHLQTAQFRLVGGRGDPPRDSRPHRLHHPALRRAQTDAAASHFRLLHGRDAVPVDVDPDEVGVFVLSVELRLEGGDEVA